MTTNPLSVESSASYKGEQEGELDGSTIGFDRLLLRSALILIALWLSLALLGRSAPAASEMTDRTIGGLTGPFRFGLIEWEIKALVEKGRSILVGPAGGLSAEEQVERVVAYFERSDAIRRRERDLQSLLALETPQEDPALERVADEIEMLHQEQRSERGLVEAILQRQVGEALEAEGLAHPVLPPVFFTFTEPPKKLVVSPRDRIEISYSRMLAAEIELLEIEDLESALTDATDLSVYITTIGGLGAYPTMVVDQASPSWIVSTIAHEWVHNYLTFFPLGVRYGLSPELVTLNETVADIVGDEIGLRVLERYYPQYAPEVSEREVSEREGSVEIDRSTPNLSLPEGFDFRSAMRETRLRVDSLLADGLVESAESYMEARRRYFVSRGYPLRALNQAYFAFHGSYGTSAASSSPIGPALTQLREMGSLSRFLGRVRWFTGVDDLYRSLG